MSTTGKSFLHESLPLFEKTSPGRISAHTKLLSPSMPGGHSLNSPLNDPTQNAFIRENNRVAGFGAGMASALIGNAGRRGNSLVVNDVRDNRMAYGSIGWGLQNKNLDSGVWRRLLPEMPHKKQYDQGGLKNLPQMDTTG